MRRRERDRHDELAAHQRMAAAVRPGDPWPLAGAALLLAATALAASYLPAQRAAVSDPMRVLREE